jgi:hypothetical protein
MMMKETAVVNPEGLRKAMKNLSHDILSNPRPYAYGAGV